MAGHPQPPNLSSLPPSLKQVQHYLKTATEHDKRDPVVSYYCRLYSMQKAMEIDRASPEARKFLVGLMDYLEKVKSVMADEDAVHNETVGQAHMENYALKMFLFADNEDRAARFNKNVVKSFYTAGMLFDVLTTFGELSEDIEKNRKYAKWKAAYIHKCLKAGETPMSGPMPTGDEEEDGAMGGAPAAPVGFEQPSLPSVPPSQPVAPPRTSQTTLPDAGSYAPPTTPLNPAGHGYPVPAAPPAPQPVSQPAWTPPSNPSGVQLTAEQYQRGIKLCKYASSAMQYEDSPTAIDNLTKALKLLTTGHET